MRKYQLILLFLVGSLLGIYGQSIAYFLDEYLITWHPLYYLTVLTCGSVVIYLIYFYLATYDLIKRNQSQAMPLFTLYFSLGIAFLISIWSLFVLLMWWG